MRANAAEASSASARCASARALSVELQPSRENALASSVALRRTVFRALSGLVSSIYYGDPRTWPGVGYPGPPAPRAMRQAYAPNLVDLAALVEPGGEA